jgi:hypothetical protein
MPSNRSPLSSTAPLIAVALSAVVSCGSSEGASKPDRAVVPSSPAPGSTPSGEAPSSSGTREGGPSGSIELDGMPGVEPGPFDPEAAVTDVSVEVHPDVNTLLVVNWTQAVESDDVWLEFSFEEGNVMSSRPARGVLGPHRDVVLGVPGETLVTLRVVLERGGERFTTRDYQGTTEAVPSGMPVPAVLTYEPSLATPDRWLFGSVEDSDGGCNNQECFYHTTFWLYIMDRQGRIVWYYADPSSNATTSFQRIARDGEYIVMEKRPFGNGGQRGVLPARCAADDARLVVFRRDRGAGSGGCHRRNDRWQLALQCGWAKRRAARAHARGADPGHLEVPRPFRRQLPVLFQHRQLEPRRRHRVDVVPV